MSEADRKALKEFKTSNLIYNVSFDLTSQSSIFSTVHFQHWLLLPYPFIKGVVCHDRLCMTCSRLPLITVRGPVQHFVTYISHPSPELETGPLSTVCDILFRANFHTWGRSPSAVWGRTMTCWQGPLNAVTVSSVGSIYELISESLFCVLSVWSAIHNEMILWHVHLLSDTLYRTLACHNILRITHTAPPVNEHRFSKLNATRAGSHRRARTGLSPPTRSHLLLGSW
jgi:hypothetical protein